MDRTSGTERVNRLPNLWTHLIFGQHALEKSGGKEWIASESLKRVFYLGCQGPDFLFYHHFLPWKKQKHMNRLGSQMHKEHCGPVLIDLVNRARGRKVGDPSALYVLGFLMHHVLDRNMHPYVFHKSGFVKWNHQRFEVILDTIMVKKHLRLETWNTPAWKQLDIGDRLPDDIAAWLDELARRYYPDCASELQAGDWNQAYRDMIRAQKLFHDPYGLKRLLTLGQIDPMVYKRKHAPLDYTNDARAEWNDPTDPKELYTASVWDLWDQAMEDAVSVLSAAYAVMRSAESDAAGQSAAQSRLAEAVGNLSYETGRPVDSGLEIKYVNPII